jgi:hypothetical protein
MKKDAYYFSHDSNAKDDPKCVLLIEQLGLEGYGIFWVLIEILREQPTYTYPLVLLPALARRFNTSTEKIQAVVKKYGLFEIENNEVFLSTSLTERMKYLDAKREKRSLAGQLGNEKRWGLIANESQCDSKTSLSKVNKSKVNKSKVKEIINIDFIESIDFKNLVNEWWEYRIKLKKPYKTQIGIERFYSELIKLSNNNIDTAKQIVNNSIINEWQGIFELKNKAQTNNTNNYDFDTTRMFEDISR